MASVTIRDHGVGKASLQAKILEETEFLAKEIEKKNGEAFQFNMLLNQAVGNIICSILFGNRFVLRLLYLGHFKVINCTITGNVLGGTHAK